MKSLRWIYEFYVIRYLTFSYKILKDDQFENEHQLMTTTLVLVILSFTFGFLKIWNDNRNIENEKKSYVHKKLD